MNKIKKNTKLVLFLIPIQIQGSNFSNLVSDFTQELKV